MAQYIGGPQDGKEVSSAVLEQPGRHVALGFKFPRQVYARKEGSQDLHYVGEFTENELDEYQKKNGY